MSRLSARVSGIPANVDPYNLTFDEIKNTPGKYLNRNGNILLVGSRKATFVSVPRDVVRTGYTRTGMLMLRKQRGGGFRLSHVVCDRNPDGVRNWQRIAGTITI